MELPYILDRAASVLIAVDFGILFGVSGIIMWHYSRHRNMQHIALLAASFVIKTGLVTGAAVFMIFMNGWLRVLGLILALIAATLGHLGLWKVWHNRKAVAEGKELTQMHAELEEMQARLDKIECERASELQEITLPDVVKVEIVEGKK